MVEAVAQAAELPIGEIRRALMVSGDLGAVAYAALAEGRPGLARMAIRLFQPLKPMLAQTAEDVGAGLVQLGTAAFEPKLDGARIQVHKECGDVRIFTRYLNDVTAAVSEIVEAVREFAIGSMILGGEALACQPNDRPRPFQVTMRRFGRKLDVERLRESIPLCPFFFDCLYIDGSAILDRQGAERMAALAGSVPGRLRVPRCDRILPRRRQPSCSSGARCCRSRHNSLFPTEDSSTGSSPVPHRRWGSGRFCGFLCRVWG